MYIYICFDVEDLVHLDSDDVPRDIANLMSDDGVIASMFVVGEKARLWERRGRWDVIAAVGQHDVGLHTDHHSVHPVVCEYLEDKGWKDGITEAMRQESPGVQDLVRLFNQFPSTWATGGSSWGPQIPAATRLLGLPSNVYSHARAGERDVCWFAGQLCYFGEVAIPGYEDTYCDDAVFAENLPDLLQYIEQRQRAGDTSLPLFGGHPTRFRHKVFWDGLNFTKGKNTPPEEYRFAPSRTDEQYQMALRNLRRMILAVRDLPGVRLTSPRALSKRYAPENQMLTRLAVHRIAQRIADNLTLQTDDWLASPAQALDLLARAILRMAQTDQKPNSIPLRTVLGPTLLPPILERPVSIGLKEMLEVCRKLVDFVSKNGQLPSSVIAGGVALGPGPILGTLARVFLGQDADQKPEKVTFQTGIEEPEIALRLAQEQVYERIPGWPPHADDLNLNNIALHTRLQSWSLKPAVLQE